MTFLSSSYFFIAIISISLSLNAAPLSRQYCNKAISMDLYTKRSLSKTHDSTVRKPFPLTKSHGKPSTSLTELAQKEKREQKHAGHTGSTCGSARCQTGNVANFIFECEKLFACIAVSCMMPTGLGVICLSSKIVNQINKLNTTYHTAVLGMGLQSDQIAPWLPVPYHVG